MHLTFDRNLHSGESGHVFGNVDDFIAIAACRCDCRMPQTRSVFLFTYVPKYNRQREFGGELGKPH